MCGIVGIYNYKNLAQVEERILLEMNNTMIHRGPDDAGIFIQDEIGLAHRRLSIIDLSTAGKQPLTNENGTIWLTFNGEIYNYLELIPELQAKGHIFKSKTDSEIIIHAYEEWGTDCLQRFNGMFAFAIWDSNNNRLFIARDRLGVKPIYYAFNDEGIVFASEIKAILKHPKHSSPDEDRESIYNYINEGYIIGNKTFFKDIYKLMPGHYLLIKNNEVQEIKYWDLSTAPLISEISEKEFVEQFRELLIDAVKIRLRSDVSVGFHLSGGLDSSAITAIASKNLDFPANTFSIRYSNLENFDEGKFIKIASEDSKTNHKELMPNLETNFVQDLENIIYLMDEPADGPAVLSKFELNKFVKENGITVALTGQGADEILGGYKRFVQPFLKDLKNPSILAQFLKNSNPVQLLGNCADHSSLVLNNLTDVFNKLFKYKSQDFKNSLFSNSMNNFILNKNTEIFNESMSNLSSALYYETSFYLPSLLHSEDRTSMGNSLETRTPFLDYRLVELTTKIPSLLKLKNFSTKYVLRESMNGILPEAIKNRKDKLGFPTPASVWFRTSQKDYLRDVIESKEFKDRGIFNDDYVRDIFNSHQQGYDHTFKLWFILNTEIWFRKFIDEKI